MAKGAHTGDLDVIWQWFQDNPNKWATSTELATEYGLERWQVNNAITQLIRTNRIMKGEKFSIGHAHYTPYRLRMESEKREEFKIAKPTAKPEKQPKMTYPVLEEFNYALTTIALRAIVGNVDRNRIQPLNANTVIIWNSPAQRENMRQMALGH